MSLVLQGNKSVNQYTETFKEFIEEFEFTEQMKTTTYIYGLCDALRASLLVAKPENFEEAVALACAIELSNLQTRSNSYKPTDALTEKLKAMNIDPIKEVGKSSEGQQGNLREKDSRSRYITRRSRDKEGSDKGNNSVSSSQNSIMCYNCNNFGHIKRECRAPKYDISASSSVDKKSRYYLRDRKGSESSKENNSKVANFIKKANQSEITEHDKWDTKKDLARNEPKHFDTLNTKQNEKMVVTSAVNESELESDEEDDLLFLKVHIQELEIIALIDAGAQVNCISKSLVKKLGYKMKERTEEIDTCGGKAKVLGIIDELIITINGINLPVKRVRVMDIANYDLILGISWLRKMKNTQDLKTNRFTINFNGIETQLQLKSKKEFLTEDEENQIFFEEEVHSEENADEGEHHKAVFTSTRVEKKLRRN